MNEYKMLIDPLNFEKRSFIFGDLLDRLKKKI